LNFKQIEEIVEESLKMLYKKDKHLIYHEYKNGVCEYNHGSERGIVFRFGIYFDKFFNEKKTQKQNITIDYSIDVEYNRNKNDSKRLPNWENGCYPDFIVHERGTNNNNLLILEFKTWWNTYQINDENKIKQFLDPNGEYKYRYGATVLIEKKKGHITWIRY